MNHGGWMSETRAHVMDGNPLLSQFQRPRTFIAISAFIRIAPAFGPRFYLPLLLQFAKDTENRGAADTEIAPKLTNAQFYARRKLLADITPNPRPFIRIYRDKAFHTILQQLNELPHCIVNEH